MLLKSEAHERENSVYRLIPLILRNRERACLSVRAETKSSTARITVYVEVPFRTAHWVSSGSSKDKLLYFRGVLDVPDAFRYSAATQNSSSKPGRTTCPEDSISKTLRER